MKTAWMAAGSLAVLILAAGLGAKQPSATPSSSATVLPRQTVTAAFAKGMPLLETNGYKIHASRRDTAGVAEIHERDTDLIYVLEGSALLVTGGQAVEARVTAPEEMRGVRIEGGQEQRIGVGDVVVVPHGVAHWFKEVNGPLLYYVVKVRE
jgi:glc operon protein GlcG